MLSARALFTQSNNNTVAVTINPAKLIPGVIGHWFFVSCWLLVVGCWLLVVGCWLLVVGG
jgi:hypothetical protein